jgi:hypothetical protein
VNGFTLASTTSFHNYTRLFTIPSREQGCAALFIASFRGYAVIAKLLLEAGANAEIKDKVFPYNYKEIRNNEETVFTFSNFIFMHQLGKLTLHLYYTQTRFMKIDRSEIYLE